MIAYTRPVAPQTELARYRAALAGELPGEALRPKDSERLLVELHSFGWTDVEIAAHTKWSTYTVARIRDRLGLRAHGDLGLVTRPPESDAGKGGEPRIQARGQRRTNAA